MSIRRIFLALVVPLFLLAAAFNGALLYAWERSEAEDGLERQAIAAAVTTAAFAESHGDLAAAMADPVRAAGLRDAAGRIPGLMALLVVGPDGKAQPIVGRPPSAGEPLPRPRAAMALPVRWDAAGRPFVIGVAPYGGGGFIAAQIDARPLFAEVAQVQRLVAGMVVGAGVLGLLLALLIASGIRRELARAGAMIEAIRTDAPAGEPEGFRIRETRDLALAVRLMRTSVAGRLARGRRELARRDRERDEAGAARAHHEAAFPPLSAPAAGAHVAVRMLGSPPPGLFYALAVAGDRAGLALGECAAETPAAALALALAARRFLEAHVLDGAPQDRIAEARAAFGITRIEWTAWSAAAPAAGAPALLDGDHAARAAAYARRAAGLAPDAVLDDLAVLLDACGVLAVIGSGEGGEG